MLSKILDGLLLGSALIVVFALLSLLMLYGVMSYQIMRGVW